MTDLTRCPSIHGSWRCVQPDGHSGAHTAPMEGNRAVRWGMAGIGCCDPECNRRADHAGPHRDGHGRSWVPIDEVEFDEFIAWTRGRDRYRDALAVLLDTIEPWLRENTGLQFADELDRANSALNEGTTT